jgi:hypothetical protein
MVSQGNDGDPHGKPRFDTGQERSPRCPGCEGTGSLSTATTVTPDRHLVTSAISAALPAQVQEQPLATEPADRHPTRLYGSSTSRRVRGENSVDDNASHMT